MYIDTKPASVPNERLLNIKLRGEALRQLNLGCDGQTTSSCRKFLGQNHIDKSR
jgi:hypothetical protein